MIYFTSDLHFGHQKIINHTGRPFDNVEEMDRTLIRNWNRIIRPEDEVYILGDLTMKGPEFASQIVSQLKGRKYLIKGNHDRFADNSFFDPSVFQWIKDYYELNWENRKFILFHYPIEEWNGYFKGSIDLHGHQHNKESYNFENAAKKIRRYDVGVDANGMKPVSIEEIGAFMDLIDG